MLKYQKKTLEVAREAGFAEPFTKKALEEARALPEEISAKDLRGRSDLRGELIITIDGADAKDLDDAVSLIFNEDGSYHLGVHIADVGHYVRRRSPLDNDAFKRATSLYFPEEVFPMLPKELSNGICSLHPKVDRLTLSVFMDIDFRGDVYRYDICESVIRSRERMTYTDVQAILDGDPTLGEKYAHIKAMLFDMEELRKLLTQRRSAVGAIDFDLPEADIVLDGEGEPVGVEKAPRLNSHKLIEEFMLVCNETVAESYFRRQLPFVYRVHEKPSEEKTSALYSFVNGLGLRFKDPPAKVKPAAFADMLRKIEGSPYAGLINKIMLRSMMKAKYSPENLGHFGLAAKYYCHFTSPIRRYPDLVIHRIIKETLSGEELEENRKKSLAHFAAEAAEQSSEREVAAEKAERLIDDFYKTVYMQQFVGDDFGGVISGVTSFGVFVELENTVEGLIWLENLPEDEYRFVEDKYLLHGRRKDFRLGDKIRVKLLRVDVDAAKIEFVYVDGAGNAATPAPRRPQKTAGKKSAARKSGSKNGRGRGKKR